MKAPDPTPRESAKIHDLTVSMQTIGNAFADDDADPHLIRVTAQIVREAADVLDAYATRWEMSRVLGQ